MKRDTRPYLTMQHMQSVAPDLMNFMQKQALDRINSVIDDIYDRASSLALRSLYFRLRETEHLQQSEIVKLFALLEPTVEFDIDQRLSKGMVATVLNDILHFQNGEIALDYLLPVIEQHKTAIITYLLTYVKTKGITPDIRGFVDALSNLKLNWPEIGIMNKSVQSLNEGSLTVDPRLANAMIAKFQGSTNLRPLIASLFTYKNMGGDMSAIDAQAKETIMPLLKAPINAKNIHKISGYISQSAILFNWPELRDIKINTIPKMMRGLEKYKQKPGFTDTASYAAHMIYIMRERPNVLEEAKPYLLDTLNKMKTPIMVDLLTLFKNGNVGPTTSCIHDFRSIGVDWPEFAAIDKSVAANKKPKTLAEAASLETLLKYAEKNINNMVPGDVASFYEVVLGLEKLAKGKTDAETNRLTVQVLFKHKAAILKQIDSLVNSNDDAVNANAIFAIGLLKRIGINWPEIQQTVDTRVADIINTVLTKFSLATALDIMKSAEQIGMSKAKIKPGIVAAGKKLLAEIEKMIDENPVNTFIENKFRLFSRLGITYKIKDSAVKTKLLNGLDKYLAEQGLTPGTVGIVEILTKYSADPAKTLSEIAALMNKNKTPVVRRLLQDVKNNNTYNLKHYLVTLMSLKLNWPELNIIIRSVGSLKSFDLYESVNAIDATSAMNLLYRMVGIKYKAPNSWDRKEYEQFIDDHKTAIIEFLQQHAEKWGNEDITSVSSGLFMIMGLQFHGRDWPEIHDLLEQHKRDVIKMLLSTIKYEGGLLRYSKDIFTTLVAMGFNWPELEIVKRSANSTRGIANE
jgi:hypothetical protein